MADPDPLASVDPDLIRSLAQVRLVVLDVDGVLTDGRVVYGDTFELQQFDARDGQGLVWLAREGVEVAWITGRGCLATERRADELGARLMARSGPKRAALRALQEELAIGPEVTLAMGDDLPDLGLASGAAVFAAPADARTEVRERAQLVTRANGGAGAVRELCEMVLGAKGRWRAIVDAAGG